MGISRYCTDDDYLSSECCRTAPWPEGVNYGYPFRIVKHNATYTPHFAYMHPYGGAGYVVSRGMIESVGIKEWRKCMYRIQCANADTRVMTCIFNAGYTLTAFGLPVVHHLRSIPAFEAEIKHLVGTDKEFYLQKLQEYMARNSSK
jgi:hypothetical protein